MKTSMEDTEKDNPPIKKVAEAIRDSIVLPEIESIKKSDIDNDMEALLSADERADDGEDANAAYEDEIAKRIKQAAQEEQTGNIAIETFPMFHKNRYPNKNDWGKKKAAFTPPKKNRPMPPPMDRFLRLYESLESLGFTEQERALFSASYLSAARVGETTALRRGDLSVSYETKDGKELPFLEFTLRTQKQRGQPKLRTVATPIFGPEAKLAKDLLAFIEPLTEGAYILPLGHFDDEGAGDLNYETKYGGSTISTLQKLRERKAYQILHKIDWGPVRMTDTTGRTIQVQHWLGNTHFLRHCRLTHLHVIYKFPIPSIQDVAGWSSPAMSQNYVHVGVDEAKMYFMAKLV